MTEATKTKINEGVQKKISHIQTMRQKYASNQKFVMQFMHLDELHYKTHIFETGIDFLNAIYPEDDTMFKKHFKTVSTQKRFWLWFKNEYKIWEHDYVAFLQEYGAKPTRRQWKSEFVHFIHDGNVGDSFHSFIVSHGKV